MNKSELIQHLSSTSGVSVAKATEYTNVLLDAIQSKLTAGERVNLSNFGVFEVSTRKAFQGHNPVSGQRISVPARKVPTCRAGKGLKDAMNA